MHELSITQNVLAIALRYAAEHDAKRIVEIDLVIGQLASVVDDSVQYYWDIISEHTVAEGAQLHFERIPVQLRCPHCATIYGLNYQDFACPTCHQSDGVLLGGDELLVKAITIEQ